MYADKDMNGHISVHEMYREEWSSVKDACEMAIGVWRTQLKQFDGMPINETIDMQVAQRVLYLKTRIANSVNFVNWLETADGESSGNPYNPFLL
ncbi:MAG: hypothetical protein PUK70_01785 [Bacteroidales bacterium]|nr:hypothetical protein [Bacteroidales bacterium]MDY6002634.1 hypothetical protein [Candidatus Cryptobacteroides sp.]